MFVVDVELDSPGVRELRRQGEISALVVEGSLATLTVTKDIKSSFECQATAFCASSSNMPCQNMMMMWKERHGQDQKKAMKERRISGQGTEGQCADRIRRSVTP
jgi:hypothetical protein